MTMKDVVIEQEGVEKGAVLCEKCGEETGVKFVGDESYDVCPECGWITF